MIKFDFNSAHETHGTINGLAFTAHWGNHLLVVRHLGQEHAYLEGDGWTSSIKERQAILKELLPWISR